jgi:hypothetical protein
MFYANRREGILNSDAEVVRRAVSNCAFYSFWFKSKRKFTSSSDWDLIHNQTKLSVEEKMYYPKDKRKACSLG